jgi:4-amino-4-deoxy-L-arabinose transferase-like glycosyltransferase
MTPTATLERPPAPDEHGSTAVIDRSWWLAITIITLLATFVRIPTLGLRHIVEGDGVHYADMARRAVSGDWPALLDVYWSNFWPTVMAAATALLGGDVVDIGRYVSLVCGTLLVPVVALLTRDLFGSVAGVLAAVFVAVHPWLLHFSTLVFTESMFLLLVMSTLLCGYRGLLHGRRPWAVATGCLACCAFATRQEGLAVAGVLTISFVIMAWWRRGTPGRRDLACALTIGGMLAVFILARALALHAQHGLWDFGFGAKGTLNFLLGMTPDGAEYAKASNEINADGERKIVAVARETSLLGHILAHPDHFVRQLAFNLRRVAVSGDAILAPVPVALGGSWGAKSGPVLQLASIGCHVLAGIGLMIGSVRRHSRGGLLLLSTVATAYLAGVVLTMVHERLLLSFVPIYLICLAGCVSTALRWCASPLRGRVNPASLVRIRNIAIGVMAAAMSTLSLLTIMKTPILAYADDPVVQREAGAWLAERFPQDRRVMTPAPHIWFYFYAGTWRSVTMPWGPIEQVIDLARTWKTDLIVAPEWQLQRQNFPCATQLLGTEAPPGLERLGIVGREAPYRVFVYKVL